MNFETVFDKENRNFRVVARWSREDNSGAVLVYQNDLLYTVAPATTMDELNEIVDGYAVYLF